VAQLSPTGGQIRHAPEPSEIPIDLIFVGEGSLEKARWGTSHFMTRIVLVVTYLIGMVVTVFLMDADPGGSWGTVCVVISVLLGAGTGDLRLATLALLAIPIAIPFGLPADPGDPALPLWVGGMYFALASSVLIVLAAVIRKFAESRLQRRRTARDSSVT
jgi:hypothetical protein